MIKQIDKKPTHHTSGSSDDIFTIGNPNSNTKEFRANVLGNLDPALVYSSATQSWYLINNRQDREAFMNGSLEPVPTPAELLAIETDLANLTALVNSQIISVWESIEFEKEKAIAEIKLVKAEC